MVFIGYPNWWDTIPMPVAAFLSENDFSEKTVCTGLHEREKSSGAKRCGYHQALPAINHSGWSCSPGGDVKNAKNEVHLRLHEREMI